MTAVVTTEDRVALAPVRWGWAGALLIVTLWLVAHIGCHGNEDTELGVTPPVTKSVNEADRHDEGWES